MTSESKLCLCPRETVTMGITVHTVVGGCAERGSCPRSGGAWKRFE